MKRKYNNFESLKEDVMLFENYNSYSYSYLDDGLWVDNQGNVLILTYFNDSMFSKFKLTKTKLNVKK